MAARAAAAAADGVIGVCEAVDDELVCDDESDDGGGGGGGGGAGVALGGVVDESTLGGANALKAAVISRVGEGGP
jgi:hypothetical protein